MGRKEDLKKIISDNEQTLIVSEIDLKYYNDKKSDIKKQKAKDKDEKEQKKVLIKDIENNIARVESKIETLGKWLEIAKSKLKQEK
jgi:hypothetical protein